MKNLILIASFILFSHLSQGQRTEDKFDSLRVDISSKLIKKGIKNFFFLSKSYRQNVEIVNEEKDTSETVYLNDFTAYVFWKDGSKRFIQKFDFRDQFNQAELHEFKAFELIEKNIKTIKSEKVLDYETMEDGKIVITVIPNEPKIKFNFNVGSNLFESNFHESTLVKSDYENGANENLNYKVNNELILIRLFKLCQKVVDELENKKVFHRIKKLETQ